MACPQCGYVRGDSEQVVDRHVRQPGAVVDLAAQLDALRTAAGKTAALADVTLESYDHADWRAADPALVERTAYLLDAVAEAAVAAVAAVDRFQGFIADRTRSEAGDDEWW